MQRTLSISKLQRKLFEQLEAQAAEAVHKRDEFLRVVLAGHDIEHAQPIAFNDEGVVVELPDAPDPPTDGAEH